MRILAVAVIALTLGFGAASAAPAVKQRPDNAPPSFRAIVPDRPATEAEFMSTPLEGTDFGVLGARGSVGVGLLLGPLGVAGNVAHVQAANKERGARLGDLTKTDLRAMLRDELARHAPTDMPASTAAQIEIIPLAIANFSTDTAFTLRCQISATYGTGEKKPWRARYSVPISGAFDTAALNAEEIKGSLRGCIGVAYALYAGHIDGTIAGGATRLYRVEGIGYKQKSPIVEAMLPDRVVVGDIFGLFEYPAKDVTFEN